MAFKRLSDMTAEDRQEADKRLKEILENMATLNDLFGGSGEKRPPVANLKVEGEFVKGVITDISTDAPVFEWDQANNKPGFQKFWVDGKPKGVAKDEAERAGLNPVHQIMITVETNDGLKRIPINSKQEREEFKRAVTEAGGSIDNGDVFGKKLDKRVGNIKEHSMKVTKAES